MWWCERQDQQCKAHLLSNAFTGEFLMHFNAFTRKHISHFIDETSIAKTTSLNCPSPSETTTSSVFNDSIHFIALYDTLNTRAWKNTNFLGSLPKFSVSCKLKKMSLYDVTKEESNNHCIHIDQLGLIQPTSIDSHSMWKQLHRCSLPHYCSLLMQKQGTERVQKRKIFPASVKF